MSDLVTSYPTPLDRARSLLNEFVDFATARSHPLPQLRYTQIGEIVRDCESVIVSVNTLTPDPFYDPVTCVSPRSATFLIDVIRNCAVAYDSQGLTIPSILEDISELGSQDGEMLYEFAQEVNGWSSKSPWSVAFSLADGGLQVAELQLTIGIP